MELVINGKQMDVGEALSEHIEARLEDLISKYFNRLTNVTVTLSKEAHSFFKTHIILHVGKDITVQAEATEKDAYAAFDHAAERIGTQLRRYKRRLRDHHERVKPEEHLLANDFVVEVSYDVEQDQADTQEPTVIAEMSRMIPTLTVSEAVMRLDLSTDPAIMFRNASHGGMNMVYRRTDGNVGWVDPKEESDLAVA